MNETHDPAAASWIESAQAPNADFTLQNLPYGIFRRAGALDAPRGGVAIGDVIVDLGAAHEKRLFEGAAGEAAAACANTTLNAFFALGPGHWSALRRALFAALASRAPAATRAAVRACLMAQAEAQMELPARIGDYTDFFASIYHATATGSLFRPDNPLMPNYKWIPVAYHGRASSIRVSGTPFHRPMGQVKPGDAKEPFFAVSRRLDYEFEMGVFVGSGNALGARVPIGAAESHIFGLCLLNDWSARDIQGWEAQPLGPFLGKSFATTISPWIVTLEALEPYRTAWTRAKGDPQPLAYLDAPPIRERGAFDIRLEAWLASAQMRAAGIPAVRLTSSNFKHLYWTIGQMLAHHTANGCNLEPGDLFATGTLSGPTAEEAGSLLELSAGGKKTIALAGGETRSFLADGDTVILRAFCEGRGRARIGFGECAGTVLPARDLTD